MCWTTLNNYRHIGFIILRLGIGAMFMWHGYGKITGGPQMWEKIGGAMAGLAGICETSAIQGRLQSGVAGNYGITGFLVAWMAGQHMLRIIPLALVMGAIISASDALQLFAQLPAAIAVVMQALLFGSVLGIAGWRKRKGI